MKKEISNWLNNHRLLKNFVGGMILVVGIIIFENFNLGWIWQGLSSVPAWLLLFNWNY